MNEKLLSFKEIELMNDAERSVFRNSQKEGQGRWLFWDDLKPYVSTGLHPDWVMDYINQNYSGREYEVQQIEFFYGLFQGQILACRLWVWIDFSKATPLIWGDSNEQDKEDE